MELIKHSSLNEFVEKWLQRVIVFLYMNFLLSAVVSGWIVWFLLVIYSPFWRYPMLLYIAWIYYDRKSGELGIRRSHWVRNLRIWKYHNDFFSAKLHKTAELPSDKNYIIGVFPHGILSSGAFCAYGNDYGGFQKIFPGLQCYIITLGIHFIAPFIREYSMRIGALPASASCLNYFLGQKKGVALALIVGGAQEAFYSRPGVYEINISKRKGFIKIAYKNGASLVPSISFGEPDIYNQVYFAENTLGRKLQYLFKKVTGVAPLIFYGQFGALPYKKPLNIVVGNPIVVEKIEEPTQEQIDTLHAKFIESLTDLFENEKHKYIENSEHMHLTIL